MIDIENEVLDLVAKDVLAEFPDAFITGEYTSLPPSLPCLCLVERDNSVYQSTIDSSGDEKYANIMYELDVYSGNLHDRKREAKRMASLADDKLRKLGFVRMMLSPVDNALDPSVYRIKGRYQATVSIKKVIYRR